MFLFDIKMGNGETDSSDGACKFFFVIKRGDEIFIDIIGRELFNGVGKWSERKNRRNSV